MAGDRKAPSSGQLGTRWLFIATIAISPDQIAPPQAPSARADGCAPKFGMGRGPGPPLESREPTISPKHPRTAPQNPRTPIAAQGGHPAELRDAPVRSGASGPVRAAYLSR
jgi:hypothetical protein